jgi:predicted ribosome quality control (RQC) complex YloA/Tae2 family protein
MSMDGCFIRRLGTELHQDLMSGRLNKIYQLSRTDFLFVVHKNGIALQWFFSLSPQAPRTHLTAKSYDKPASPTGFVMLLRKYLEGGIIREIGSVNDDRILKTVIDIRNDFGEKITYFLIMELMGKSANLLLTEIDGTIIDCHKRVSPFDGQQRAFLKGLPYEVPRDNKIPPSDSLAIADFFERTKTVDEPMLVDSIRGLSPLSAAYLVRKMETERLGPKETFERMMAEPIRPTEGIWGGKSRFYWFDLFPEGEKRFFSSLSALLDEVFFETGQKERTLQVSKQILQLAKREYEKNKDKLEKLTRELEEAKNGHIQRIYGDTVRQYSDSIQKGDDQLKAFAFELNQEVVIPLDRLLTPNQNAMAYYRRYKKSRQAVGHLETQIRLTRQQIDYFDLLLTQMETASLNDLMEITEELKKNGYLSSVKPKKNSLRKPNYDVYFTGDGVEILVGKNNLQNELITHQLGKPTEWWFHTKDIPGSHVLVRSSDPLSENTVRVAANLAALHSKARHSSSVPVDYTLVKWVKKIPGVPGSFVTLSHQKTIYIDPDPGLIDRLTQKK